MESIISIRHTSLFKVLGDERRVHILRLLMSKPATLSQLGRALDLHPAKVRFHLKKLEEAGLVGLTETNVTRGYIEKYYRASARAYQVNLAILPQQKPDNLVMITGSHDLALDLLAKSICEQQHSCAVYSLPVGSLDGLIALRQGIGQMAAIHLLDAESGEYNLPYVRRLFPDKRVHLITLAHRQQGLIVAVGNPLGLVDLRSLSRPEVRFINRRAGSGTRLWIDQQLKAHRIMPDQVSGYGWEVNTHSQVAQAVVQGQADVGVGQEAAARSLGLEFVPLFQERFDLVYLDDDDQREQLTPLLDYLQTSKFRQGVADLGGYETRQMGAEIPV